MKNLVLSFTLMGLMSWSVAHTTEARVDAKTTVVYQTAPVPDTKLVLGLGLAEFPPNAAKPRHKASGPEVWYVLEGEVYYRADGKPTLTVHAGETFQIPAGEMHVTSAGPRGAKILASWVLDPARPFNIPPQGASGKPGAL